MKIFLILFSLWISSCSMVENTPELIEGLRAFGVQAEKPSYAASDQPQTANLSVLLVSLESSENINVRLLDVEPPLVALPLRVKSSSLVKYANVSLIRVELEATIPVEQSLLFSKLDGIASLAYALEVEQSGQVEKIKGQLAVFKADSEALEEDFPDLRLLSPAEDGIEIGASNELKAELNFDDSDDYRISWLVSSGSIERPRAIEAEWLDPIQGEQLVIVTARGLRKGRFVYQLRQVERP